MRNINVSILMLTHNAPDYVKISIESVRQKTSEVLYELVVVDNASDHENVDLLKDMKDRGLIDKLVLSPKNTLFAEGNNIASRHANAEATHFLLLNSDIEVRDSQWLKKLLEVHESPGITSYGVVEHAPVRVDGYCLLIDAELYRKHGGLDEGFQWWWAVTKLQANILAEGLSVKGYRSHDSRLFHFGGKSGDSFKNAKGMTVSREEVFSWFQGRKPIIIDDSYLRKFKRLLHQVYKKLNKK